MEIIKCNTKVAMEKEKWPAESRFTSSDEKVVDQLKLNAKNKNTTFDGFFYNFVENIL